MKRGAYIPWTDEMRLLVAPVFALERDQRVAAAKAILTPHFPEEAEKLTMAKLDGQAKQIQRVRSAAENGQAPRRENQIENPEGRRKETNSKKKKKAKEREADEVARGIRREGSVCALECFPFLISTPADVASVERIQARVYPHMQPGDAFNDHGKRSRVDTYGGKIVDQLHFGREDPSQSGGSESDFIVEPPGACDVFIVAHPVTKTPTCALVGIYVPLTTVNIQFQTEAIAGGDAGNRRCLRIIQTRSGSIYEGQDGVMTPAIRDEIARDTNLPEWFPAYLATTVNAQSTVLIFVKFKAELEANDSVKQYICSDTKTCKGKQIFLYVPFRAETIPGPRTIALD